MLITLAPTFKSFFTQGLTSKGLNAWLSRGVTVSSTILVSTTSSLFIPLTVSFKSVPCKPSISAKLLT